jgi:hypothetical protein
MDAPLLRPRGLRYTWLCACWAVHRGAKATLDAAADAPAAALFDTGARLTCFGGRAGAPYSAASLLAAAVAWFLPSSCFRAKVTRDIPTRKACSWAAEGFAVSPCGSVLFLGDTYGSCDDVTRLALAKFSVATGELLAHAFAAHCDNIPLLLLVHMACTTDGFILLVLQKGDEFGNNASRSVAFHEPQGLRYCTSLHVDGARSACGTHEHTGVLTPSALHIFRVGAREASVVVAAGDVEFGHVAVIDGIHPQFIVWAQTPGVYPDNEPAYTCDGFLLFPMTQARGLHHGHARVYTSAGALVRQVDLAMLPTVPVSLAASRHGELAFLCVTYSTVESFPHVALVDVASGEVCVRDALPRRSRLQGIAFAPTGIACCDGDGVLLLQ